MKTELVLAISILSSSFLGSWHCTAMCGPIACNASVKNKLAIYHLGRLLSYTLLGFIGGSVGSLLLDSSFWMLRIVSTVLMAVLIIWMGISILNPKVKFPFRLHPRLVLPWKASAFFLGFFTVMLPCGWLYTYFSAALVTKNPVHGALVMAIFWLGGLPALSILPGLVKTTSRLAQNRHKKISSIILIISGIYSLISFFAFS